MSITLTQTLTAISPKLTSSFLGVGGTGPYTYTVLAGGAGGTINPSTGLYTAPNAYNSNPTQTFDTIQVTDSLLATATSVIIVGNPLLLFCDIIQTELGLAPGRVYLWDQKIFQPSDYNLYVAVSVSSCKPFGNNIQAGASGWDAPIQSVNMLATLDIDILSRGPDARDRKEEIILALNSIYSQAQQEANSFYIGNISPASRFINLSDIDGAAIPYRFRISVNMQYFVTKTKTVPYFNTFQTVQETTNP